MAALNQTGKEFDLFQPFLRAYPPSPLPANPPPGPQAELLGIDVPGFSELMTHFAGHAFAGGIYRLHSESSGQRADDLIGGAFPWLNAVTLAFGYDWLGRQFVLDSTQMHDGKPLVVMCDLVTHEAFNVLTSFVDFHNQTLIKDRDAALEFDLFQEWASIHPELLPLRMNQIVSYRIPLVLGGKHSVENLEVGDFEVEIEFTGQIDRQLAELPEGTPIRDVEID